MTTDQGSMHPSGSESVCLPDMLTTEQQEILTTLRALAGLVAHAVRKEVTASDQRAMARARADLVFWRDFLLGQTRRLLPGLIAAAGDGECHLFAEGLVRDAYREDQEAHMHHRCDPLTCTHEAHGHD